MVWFVYPGLLLCTLGLGGIAICIVLVLQTRQRACSDREIRQKLQKLLPLNYGSLLCAVLGLCFVVIGLIL